MAKIKGYPFQTRRLSEEEGGGILVTFSDLPGCMSDGETLAQAKANAADAVRGYLASCAKHGDPIPEPGSGGIASGKFLARLPKGLHARLIERARVEGVSMNQMLTAIVAEGLGVRTHQPRGGHPAQRSKARV